MRKRPPLIFSQSFDRAAFQTCKSDEAVPFLEKRLNINRHMLSNYIINKTKKQDRKPGINDF